MTDSTHGYVGRFAPSPTGPLHFGSLVAALASFLDARAHQGIWRVRMEDLDPPREAPGAADTILRCLEAHYLHWDGDVLYQSGRHEAYRHTLRQLEQEGLTYRCTCSRQELHNASIYSGHCRHRPPSADQPAAIRLDVAAALHHLKQASLIAFTDLVCGAQTQDLLQAVGDFVVHRKDGLFAYQLAVVVDDVYQDITHVIRGADLLDSTPRQILLFHLLHTQGTDFNQSPVYGHVPLVMNREGQKLSKQNQATALDPLCASDNLYRALQFLQQAPPAELRNESPTDILRWAIPRWRLACLAPGHPVLGHPQGLE